MDHPMYKAASMEESMNRPATAPREFEPAVLEAIRDWLLAQIKRNAARMQSALHPQLAKRMIYTVPKTGRSQFNHLGAMQLAHVD